MRAAGKRPPARSQRRSADWLCAIPEGTAVLRQAILQRCECFRVMLPAAHSALVNRLGRIAEGGSKQHLVARRFMIGRLSGIPNQAAKLSYSAAFALGILHQILVARFNPLKAAEL